MIDDVRKKPTRVLVPLDGSRAAATALPVARTIARQLGASVEVFHVPTGKVPRVTEGFDLGAEGERVVIAPMQAADKSAADVILREAASADVDLVILTIHGREIEAGRGLGSIAEQVVARTDRPVLLVRPEAVVANGPQAFNRLLVPVDGTPTTALALEPATKLAYRLGACLDVLYVAGPEVKERESGEIGAPRYVDQPQHEWGAWGDEVRDRLVRCLANCPESVPLRVALAHGDIAIEIDRFASEHGADAIVLVRRSRFEPHRAAVLRAVLARTQCPVLLLGVS